MELAAHSWGNGTPNAPSWPVSFAQAPVRFLPAITQTVIRNVDVCPLQCPVRSLQDAVKGLFVCCLFLDYVALSRRFIPELINFLLGILYIALPNAHSQGKHGAWGAIPQPSSPAEKRAPGCARLVPGVPCTLLVCGTQVLSVL